MTVLLSLASKPIRTLAQAPAREWTTHDSISLVIVVGALITAVVILGVVLLALRARLFAKDAAAEGSGTLLEHLRGMRDRGEISREEYDAAKHKMVKRLKADAGVSKGSRADHKAPTRAKPERAPARPQSSAIVAPPGFDLTGEALPKKAPRSAESDMPPGFGDLGPSDT